MNSEMEKRREEGREQEKGNKTTEIRKYGARRKRKRSRWKEENNEDDDKYEEREREKETRKVEWKC